MDARLVQSVIELHATIFHAYETGWCEMQLSLSLMTT